MEAGGEDLQDTEEDLQDEPWMGKEGDSVWMAQDRNPSVLRSVGLTALLFAAVLPAAALFALLAWFNLSYPYRLLDEAPYESWPPFNKWAHVLWAGVLDAYWNLYAPISLWAVFRTPTWLPAWTNFLLACLPGLYIISLQLLGLYDPKRATVHLPLNLLWAGIALANAVAPGVTPGGTALGCRRRAASTGWIFGSIFVPVLSAIFIRYAFFDLYVSDDFSALHKTVVVSYAVPCMFSVSHRVAWGACLELMDQGYHPGSISRLLLLALSVESVHRRMLLCATNDLALTFFASLNMGAMDALMQLSIDFRDGLFYIVRRCERPPREFFKSQGRRRLRADNLILHLMCEHLAIMIMTTFLLVMQIQNRLPGRTIITTLVNLVVQAAVRFGFDVATFDVEARYGSMMRKLCKVGRWYGIPVHEVWQMRKRELIWRSIHVTLLTAGAFMFYLKGFFFENLKKQF